MKLFCCFCFCFFSAYVWNFLSACLVLWYYEVRLEWENEMRIRKKKTKIEFLRNGNGIVLCWLVSVIRRCHDGKNKMWNVDMEMGHVVGKMRQNMLQCRLLQDVNYKIWFHILRIWSFFLYDSAHTTVRLKNWLTRTANGNSRSIITVKSNSMEIYAKAETLNWQYFLHFYNKTKSLLTFTEKFKFHFIFSISHENMSWVNFIILNTTKRRRARKWFGGWKRVGEGQRRSSMEKHEQDRELKKKSKIESFSVFRLVVTLRSLPVLFPIPLCRSWLGEKLFDWKFFRKKRGKLEKRSRRKKRVKGEKECEKLWTEQTNERTLLENKFCGTIKYKLWKLFLSSFFGSPFFPLLNNIKYYYDDVKWNGTKMKQKLSAMLLSIAKDVKMSILWLVGLGKERTKVSYNFVVMSVTKRKRRIETTEGKKGRIIFFCMLNFSLRYFRKMSIGNHKIIWMLF